MEIWIAASLVAMIANVGKVLLVKTRCQHIDSWQLVFYARTISAVVLCAALIFVDYRIHDPGVFWGATSAAALITIGASLLYLHAVKAGDLAIVTPLQATIPIFMLPGMYILYGEIPRTQSLWFIGLIIASVSVALYTSSRDQTRASHPTRLRAALASLAAAGLFGVSTVLDRVAIAAASNGALVFSAYWNLITVVMLLPMWFYLRKSAAPSPIRQPAVHYYVAAVLLAFIAQQYAVQFSLELENGATYVKSIVMTHIVFAALFGIVVLKEKVRPAVLIASLMTVLGGVGLVWSI
ncbi:MAG: EamA family transporter [Pseudomonadota bacterium]